MARQAARAVLGSGGGNPESFSWLEAHEAPAAARLYQILQRYGGALLADAVGLGKSYVALACALLVGEPFLLVVPAVLLPQWSALLAELRVEAAGIVTHESLSARGAADLAAGSFRLCIVDEAHRFRNPNTRRYRALAKATVGVCVLLVTATPVHNVLQDLLHLFKLFLRDDALVPLGIASLATADTAPRELVTVAIARLTVARSRGHVQAAYAGGRHVLSFPERGAGRLVRAGPLPDAELVPIVARVGDLEPTPTASLFRFLLLSRLASSVPAFRATLRRYVSYLEQTGSAAREGRLLTRRDFRRLFPDASDDSLQLALFPILLPEGGAACTDEAHARAAWLEQLMARSIRAPDPKLRALIELIESEPIKTIVFTNSRETASYLSRQLARWRAAAVFGDTGQIGPSRAQRALVLRAFAPAAQRATPPPPALETDLLIATDLVSEGLNLQDAGRVIHYDLPWTPARLAQRVGRIDRLGSKHSRIATVSFVPPAPLAQALALEERLASKVRAQTLAGAAHVETVAGPAQAAGLDWCDRLDALLRGSRSYPDPPESVWGTVRGERSETVLVVRIAALTELLVVDDAGVRADPSRATDRLETAATAEPLAPDRAALEAALARAAPLVRARLEAIARTRWRATDRDRLGRRLVPLVLAAARAAARRGDSSALLDLDATATRLTRGMTAGEAQLLDELVAQPAPLTARDLVAWHARLPPQDGADSPPAVELVAALVVQSR